LGKWKIKSYLNLLSDSAKKVKKIREIQPKVREFKPWIRDFKTIIRDFKINPDPGD